MNLPLYYCGLQVANAQIDDSVVGLRDFRWTLKIPESIRRLLKTTDVIAASLREDESVLRRCSPFLQHRGLVVYLNRVVVRPALVVTLQNFALKPSKELRHEISLTLASVGRIVHLNSSRVDCRVDNLREITPMDFIEVPEGVWHNED